MSRVTCSLCNMKIDELKRQSQIVSTFHLEKCEKVHNDLTTKLFKMIFDIRPELQEINNWENQNTHDFWHL